jgi:hypothetical protein
MVTGILASPPARTRHIPLVALQKEYAASRTRTLGAQKETLNEGKELAKRTVERLIENNPFGSTTQELRLLQEMAQAMRDASICGLGQTASSALLSAVNRWNLFS